MIKNKFLRNRAFIRNIGVLVSGSLIAQLIAFAVAPLLTRIFSVEELGKYTYFLSIVHTFMAVMCLRYDAAIVYEHDDRNVNALIKLSVMISLALAFLISAAFGVYFLATGKLRSYGYALLFVFFTLLSYGIINTLAAYNNRNEEYKVLTSVYFIRTAFQNIGAVLMGLITPVSASLLIPYAAGQLFGMKRQGNSLRGKFRDIAKTNKTDMIKAASIHKNQPLFSAPALFVNSFSYSSITMIIEMLFSFQVVGYYSMSVRLLGMPISLVSGNVSKVFFKEASDEYRMTGGYKSAFRKTLYLMTAIAIPMVILIMWLAPGISRIVFGETWEIAGTYMRILAPMFGARFVMTTLTPGLLVCGKQKTELIMQLILLSASVFSYIIVKTQGLPISSFLYVVCWSKFVVFVAFIFVIGRYAKGQK